MKKDQPLGLVSAVKRQPEEGMIIREKRLKLGSNADLAPYINKERVVENGKDEAGDVYSPRNKVTGENNEIPWWKKKKKGREDWMKGKNYVRKKKAVKGIEVGGIPRVL